MTDYAPPGFSFYYPWRVRYSEIDSQEIVFNSRYLEFADQAVTEYFRARGFPPRELASLHYCDIVVVRAEVDYLAPARLDDLLHIFVRAAPPGRSSLSFHLEIRSAASDHTLYARLQLKYVNFDRATGKSAPVPDSVRRALAAFEKHETPT